MKFEKTSPCGNCPYRRDAPLAHWDRAEFKKVLESENTTYGLGHVFFCHKADGHVCRGFLMDQDNRDFPNNNLRLQLMKARIGRDYLDRLHCIAPLFSTPQEMCEANFPGITNQ